MCGFEGLLEVLYITLQVWPFLYVIEHRSIDFISTASGQMKILFLVFIFIFIKCPLCNDIAVTEQAIECCIGLVW